MEKEMEMSMRGSGIYSESYAVNDLECENESCDFAGTDDVHFDDWGNGSWTCEKCETENTYEFPNREDDDSDYDYWRENS